MQCPLCGVAGLIRDTRNFTYCYNGNETVIHDITGEFCIECNEGILDEDNAERYSTAMLEFQRLVNNTRSE